MSKDPTSPTPTQMSFLEDSPASLSVKPDIKRPNPTPDISGRKCLGSSKSVGRLGLLEKTLLESSNWAWTKYSLTWRTKATPQGRLIFQLARLAPRTSGKESGLLHTPTAKGNQMAPSMLKHKGNWATWATPNTMDHLPARPQEECSINQKNRKGRKRSGNLREQVVHPEMWPTPRASNPGSRPNGKGGKILAEEVAIAEGIRERGQKMWPTPRVSDTEGGVVKNVEMNNGSFSRRNKKGERWGVKLKDAVNHTDPNSGGSLNPQWVAWLMGYKTEYLKSVPWETQSSRKSRRK